ncbi:RadC family protein [Taibaiella koreensis]|uniref:RadC family protein n=1 Tax=Taibaiella koreensis TaxID=1268548 RepID=UPI000E59BBE2|nr:DNA repair protein RadC [Taibaiella koreensis]
MKTNDAVKPTSIKYWAEDDQPREKLCKKGYEALSDSELIAILIQSGNKEKSAVDLARDVLLLGNHSLARLGKLQIPDFQKIKGIGKARAITLAAALELGRRRQVSEGMEQKEVPNSKTAAEILVPLLGDLPHERFCLICLSASNKLLHYEYVSSGGLTSTIVDTKLVFKIAIQHLATKLIIAHNHPSGNLKPSVSDKNLTEKIKHGARMLDLFLMDHLIVADKQYFSFADEGLL